MDKKQHGNLGSIFFWGIPILFTVILCVIVLNFFGIPVGKTLQEWGNKLPIINKIIPDPAPTQALKLNNPDNLKQQSLTNSKVLKEKDQKIIELNKQLSSNQTKVEDLQKSNGELQKQLDKKQTQAVQDQMKQVAGIYANIPAAKAAAMFESMPLEDASLNMSLLEQDQQSGILGSMKDAKKAAQILMMLKEVALLKETDQTALKNQIHELALKQENPTEVLAETITGMPPTQSAGIIQSMMATNSQVAMNIMKNVTTNSRSQILTEISKVDAKLAAEIATNLN
jgi:flagellar motility protein MotE (MotC chaperone)